MPKKKPALAVGDVFAMPQARGDWGACQVVRVDGRDVEVAALDHRSEARPSLADVAPRAVVCERYNVHRGEPARVHVIDAPPTDFIPLGALAPALPALPSSNSWASWQALRDEAAREARWRAIPEDVRRRYREGAASNTQITIALPAGPLKLPRRAYAVRLAFDEARPERTWTRAGESRSFDWGALDALPCLSHVAVRGDAPGLLAWLATRPLVNDLIWEDFSADALDLRGLGLTKAALRPARLASLRLPDGLDELALAPLGAPLTVVAEADGAFLDVHLNVWTGDDLASLRGLGEARSLTVAGFSALDLAAVARAFPKLRALTLTGAPGRVQGAASLAALPSLEDLRVWGCVGFDVENLPPLASLPALSQARFTGLRASDRAALHARWGKDRRVASNAPIDDAQVFAVADFPLLRWPQGQRKELVCAGYTRAARAILKGELTPAAAAKALGMFATAVARALEHTGPLTAAERADVEASWQRLTAHAAARAPGASFAKAKKTW
ncbi:MAG: hypothetical protein U0324_31065 [Polyangiales bacterium]